MRVCFINRCYWPDAEATGQLLTQLCEYLAPRWDVTAVVGQPNFAIDEPASTDGSVAAPSESESSVPLSVDGAGTHSTRARVRTAGDDGQECPSYGADPARGRRLGFGSRSKAREPEMRNGVRIERLPHLQLPKHRRLGRLANLISFTNQVRRWGRSARCDADVLVCETDPFFLPIVTRRIARRSNAKLVFYLQDIYPDVAVALGMVRDGRIADTIRNRLRAAYREADAIVVLDEDMRNRLLGWGLEESKIEIVPNWVDCSLIRPVKTANVFRREQGIDDQFVVMHSGNMGLTQRLDVLIRAMRDSRVANRVSENAGSLPVASGIRGEREASVPMHENGPGAHPAPLRGQTSGFGIGAKDILLALVGGGAKRRSLEALASEQSNVRFWDYQPQDRLAESLSAADLHVISMDERITGCIAPSKLYGILGSGTPILAIVPRDSAVWRFVEEHALGWTAEPGDTAAIAEAIVEAASCDREMMRRMGETGRQLAETEYERVHCCNRFEAILERLVASC